MAKVKIKDRISAALRAAGGTMKYHRLAEKVFPQDDYPNAWNYPTKGGPPGCYMVLSRAIREHGFSIDFAGARAVVHTTVGLGKNRVE